MGWLSGIPEWVHKAKEAGLLPPGPDLIKTLEDLRIHSDTDHEEFARVYGYCWWHNEAAMRATYVALKRMKPDSDERDIIAATFAPLAMNKVGLWYKDEEEIVQTILRLKSLEDAISEHREKHQSWISILSPKHQHLVNTIEPILEKYGRKSMEELFHVFDESIRRHGG